MRSMRVVAALLLCCAACGGADDAPAATGPVLTTPTTPAPATAAPPAATTPTVPTTIPAAVTYTVEAGDSLFAIAERLCTDLDTLVATNAWPDGINHPIFPGDTITVPAGACAPTAATAPSTAPAGGTALASAACAHGCVFPYGDPSDALTVYADGACTDIRRAIGRRGMGPDSITELEVAVLVQQSPQPPPVDQQLVRDEAESDWSEVIDAYAGLGDVPEDVTTALGRGRILAGDVAAAYVEVLLRYNGPADAASDAAWTALQARIDEWTRNFEPVRADLDARCPGIGTTDS